MREFKGKKILVTGGSGSIGSKIVIELLRYDPQQIRVFSRDESKQLELMHRVEHDPRVRFLIGDIRDKNRLAMAMENINIVFHAAAMKHVFFCEDNPFEAVNTNVLGTQNIIDCAFSNNVEKVIGISTDKASDPSNVMGCTKLLAEKIMLASYHYRGHKRTKFSFVRFGNVLWSRGSVLPLWHNQIKAGNPVTVTDMQMARFFMPISSAIELVFKATKLMHDREIFILKMPSLYIKDLAQAMINVYAPKHGLSPDQIEIKLTDSKPGERLHEKLLSKSEAEFALETDDMFILTPEVNANSEPRELFMKMNNNTRNSTYQAFTTEEQPKLSLSQIEEMIRENIQD